MSKEGERTQLLIDIVKYSAIAIIAYIIISAIFKAL